MECTDVTTVEELSIFCHWFQDGVPGEHFLEIVPLKSVDAKTIYSTLDEFLNEKNVPISKLVGVGYNEAATLFGEHEGVQSLLKKNSPSCSVRVLPLPPISTYLCSSGQ